MSKSSHNSPALTDLLDSCENTISKLQDLEGAIKGAASLLAATPENQQSISMLRLLADQVSSMWCHIDSNIDAFRETTSEGGSHE